MTKTFKELRITPALIEFDDNRIVNVKTISEVQLGPDRWRCLLRLFACSFASNLLAFGVVSLPGILYPYSDGGLSIWILRILIAAVVIVAVPLAIAMFIDWVRSLLALFRLFGVVALKWPARVRSALAWMTFIIAVAGAALPFGVTVVNMVSYLFGSGAHVLGGLFGALPAAAALIISALLYRFVLRFNVLSLQITSPFPAGVSVVSPNPEFLHQVMSRIREAMLAEPRTPISYVVNVQAERIERFDASTQTTTVVDSPGAAVIGGHANGVDIATGAGRHLNGSGAKAGAPTTQSRSLIDAIKGAARPAAKPERQAPPPAAADRIVTGRPAAATLSVQQSPGAISIGGGVTNSQLSTSVTVNPVADMDALMRLLTEQNVAHHEMLNSYLAAVRDHLAGGRTPRDQAVGYWRWFVDYALGALTGMDTVLALVERLNRVLLRN